MGEKELGEALNAIYELEMESYQTMHLERELLRESGKYAIPKLVPAPVFRPKHFDRPKYLMLFCVIGVLLGILLFFLGWKLFDIDLGLGSFLVGAVAFFLLVCLGGEIGSSLGSWLDTRIHKNVVAEERAEWGQGNSPQMAEYQRALNAEQQRLSYERGIVATISSEREDLQNLLRKESAALTELYDKAGIGADYRRLIPMRYMANFFNLGISRKLEGTDGLYYLVRQELRADQFNASLREISEKLDTIISKQSEIYRELLVMEEQNRQIVRELENGFGSVSNAVSAAANGIEKSIETSVSRYVGRCLERQNGYLFLATRWGR